MNFQELNYSDNETAPSLKLFWVIAVPLTLTTIVFPLIVGVVFRFLVKLNIIQEWRIALDIIMCVIFCLVNWINTLRVLMAATVLYLIWQLVVSGYSILLADWDMMKNRRWLELRESFQAYTWPKYLDCAITIVMTIFWSSATYLDTVFMILFFGYRIGMQLYFRILTRRHIPEPRS